MTETQTVDLAAWLTRIWDEEEARELTKRTWRPEAPPMDVTTSHDGEGVFVSNPGSSIQHWLSTEDYDRTYLTPAPDEQVLARIAADRKILELHSGDADICFFTNTGYETHAGYSEVWRASYGTEFVCDTLKALASPYKGREGWQEEWE